MTTPVPYPEFVAKLAKSGEDILAGLTPFKCQLMHSAIGITGEALELIDCVQMRMPDEQFDMENFIEELGDMEFFLEHMRALLGFPYSSVQALATPLPFVHLPFEISMLNAISGTLLDVVKKHVIYNKPLDVDSALNCMAAIEEVMGNLRRHAGLDREGILAANRVKLGKRYKDLTYSDAEAQARADKA